MWIDKIELKIKRTVKLVIIQNIIIIITNYKLFIYFYKKDSSKYE